MQIDVADLSKKMEEVNDSLENAFAFTESLYFLEKFCLKHGIGERDLRLQRYICPYCGKKLKKIERC